ncbi:MAG: heme ABC exporter ATP-binding protein CcmA [Proteobacteria bacterium]|nr:heme ABC exporter ATP-binding protein CcmA [Pseudomonadota bacterium]
MSLFEGRDLLCVRGERRVFEGLSFALAAGGLLVLTGPNGSGKSSLLRIMAGLLRPAAGALLWDGTPVRDDPDAQAARLQYLGHLDAVKPVLSAAENLMFWAALHGGGAAEVTRALDGFDLGALAEVPGRMLSAGQKRRVALARLLAAPAEVWLLDEPTVGLDAASLARLTGAIDADWAKSREIGVTGVPTFVAGGQGVVGAQPYEAIEKLGKEVGAHLTPSALGFEGVCAIYSSKSPGLVVRVLENSTGQGDGPGL